MQLWYLSTRPEDHFCPHCWHSRVCFLLILTKVKPALHLRLLCLPPGYARRLCGLDDSAPFPRARSSQCEAKTCALWGAEPGVPPAQGTSSRLSLPNPGGQRSKLEHTGFTFPLTKTLSLTRPWSGSQQAFERGLPCLSLQSSVLARILLSQLRENPHQESPMTGTLDSWVSRNFY